MCINIQNKRITSEMLVDQYACPEAMELFREKYPKGVMLKNLIELMLKFNHRKGWVCWVIDHFSDSLPYCTDDEISIKGCDECVKWQIEHLNWCN